MKVVNESGVEIDASFSEEPGPEHTLNVVFESRSRTQGKENARNTASFEGLQLLLSRLGAAAWTLQGARVDSAQSSREGLDESEPGAHRVSLSAPQHLPLERQLSLALGETARLDLSLARQPRVAITSSPWLWTAIGAAVLGAAATAIALTCETRLDPYGGTTDSLLSGVRSVP